MSQYPPPGNYPPPEPFPGQSGQPGQSGYWQESPKSKGLAIAALVLGILAVISFWTIIGGILFGVLAVVFGIIATVKARRGTAGGTVMGVIGLVLGILSVIGAVVLALIGWNLFVDLGGRDFVDCTSEAGNDQNAISQCEEEFNQRIEDKWGVTPVPEPGR